MTVVLVWGMIHMIGKIIQQRRQEMGDDKAKSSTRYLLGKVCLYDRK